MASKLGEHWKMPPLIKIYEALGALADDRVQLQDEQRATVLSSDASKTYRVEFSDDGRTISSNDNASYWQGYLGYPAIAVMLKRGLCPVRSETLITLAGIRWNELNRRFHNNYRLTIEEVMRQTEQRGFDPKIVAAEADLVWSKVKEFAPLRGRRRAPAVAAQR